MTGTVIGGSVRLFCLELRDRTLCVAPCVGLQRADDQTPPCNSRQNGVRQPR
jgi:hypothetical protein